MGRPWTDQELERAARLRQQGQTYDAIGWALGRRATSVQAALTSRGLAPRVRASVPTSAPARAWRLFFELGLGLEETAARLAVSPDQVEDWLRARARTQRMDRR